MESCYPVEVQDDLQTSFGQVSSKRSFVNPPLGESKRVCVASSNEFQVNSFDLYQDSDPVFFDFDEEFDSSPYPDLCLPGSQGVRGVWQDRYRISSAAPNQGRNLVHIFPSKGDKPPSSNFVSSHSNQSIREVPEPLMLGDPPEFVLDESLSLRQRWDSLSSPPDRVATEIAVNGFSLTFKKDPPPVFRWKKGSNRGAIILEDRIPRNAKTSPKQIPFLKPFIASWLSQGIVTDCLKEIPDKVHCSPLFHVPKDKDKIRPIIDLSFMNKFVVSPKFKMEHLPITLRGVQTPSWGAKIDIQDAFLSVWISVFFQRYFAFWFDGRMYMFKRMPFGLTTAPWIFTRLMRVVKGFLRRKGVKINSFIDDFITWSHSLERASLHLDWTLRLLRWLGFSINIKKTSVSPTQSLQYLGVDLDFKSLTMCLPKDKIARLLSLVASTSKKSTICRADLEVLVGLVTFSYSVIPIGRMYVSPLLVWMNTHTNPSFRFKQVPVTSVLRELLRPFCRKGFLSQNISFKMLIPDLVVMTDASNFGWSGVILPYCIEDPWSESDSIRHINEKEMLAITYFFRFMSQTLSGKHVAIHTDNNVVLFCLKQMGSLRSPSLDACIREFLSLCLAKDITFEVRYIESSLNVLADRGSRAGFSPSENCLDPSTVSLGFALAGINPRVAVDLCATLVSSKCDFYISPCPDNSPGCLGTDVRRVNWDRFDQIYLFPPFQILELLLPKIEVFQGRALIIAPQTPLATPVLSSRARLARRLPSSYFLYQKDFRGEVVLRPKFHDLWMWVI